MTVTMFSIIFSCRHSLMLCHIHPPLFLSLLSLHFSLPLPPLSLPLPPCSVFSLCTDYLVFHMQDIHLYLLSSGFFPPCNNSVWKLGHNGTILRMPGHEDRHEFKASLGFTARPCVIEIIIIFMNKQCNVPETCAHSAPADL